MTNSKLSTADEEGEHKFLYDFKISANGPDSDIFSHLFNSGYYNSELRTKLSVRKYIKNFNRLKAFRF